MKNPDNFTHIDRQGRAKIVDVSDKKVALRTAKARGYIILNKDIIGKIKDNQLEKGDVLTVAKIAGVSAAKKNWELIPLCHQIRLTDVDIDFRILEKENKIEAVAKVKGFDVTGVEMEALMAVSISLLAIYDMCKAVSKEMRIEGIELLEKTGGKGYYLKNYQNRRI